MSNNGLSAPPSGDENWHDTLAPVICVFYALSVISVALRFYTRIFISKCIGWDDWTILIAVVCLRQLYSCRYEVGKAHGEQVSMQICFVLDLFDFKNGLGRHQYYVPAHQLQNYKRYDWAQWIQTFFTLMFTKFSICLLLLRIAITNRYIRPLQALMVVLLISSVVSALMFMFQCNPIAAAWDQDKKETAKCFSKGIVERIIISHASGLTTSSLWLSVQSSWSHF
ncbi:MAG: hypothetical protein Q9220_005073 [cf. Caloplaca sp. 1 TL-2023]